VTKVKDEQRVNGAAERRDKRTLPLVPLSEKRPSVMLVGQYTFVYTGPQLRRRLPSFTICIELLRELSNVTDLTPVLYGL
jgi:hypothetical protein